MTLLAYLLKTIVVSAILYGYYRLFLRNKLFHHYNRFFLLSALLLSMVLPFIRIPLLYQPENPVNDAMYRTVAVMNPVYEADLPARPLNESVFTLMNSIYLLYAAGALFLLTLVIKSLLYIRTLRRRYPAEKITSLRFYNTHEPGTPFSFFRSIFWNDQLPFNSSEGQQIFRHELFHVQHRHSVDRLISEVLTALFWFNPFFHLIKKELKAIHEFLADQFAISNSDRYAYATLLVQQALEPGRHAVTNHFFQNHIKRRIAMITQFKQSKYGYWSRVMILPVSLLLFCFVSLYAKKPAPRTDKNPEPVILEQPLEVFAATSDEGTAATTFQSGGPAKSKDTIPASAAKEKELQKITAKQLDELKRKLQEQEEVMQKSQRAELETLKKQMIEQELMARELEQNRKGRQEEVLKLKMEMLARRQNLKEAAMVQNEKLQKNLQMKQQAEEEMMKARMREIETKSREHMEISKIRQAELQNLKHQLQERENLLKKQQQEELRRFREELQRREEEMKDKERELRRQKENQKEQSSYKIPPAKSEKEAVLWTETFALNYNAKEDISFQDTIPAKRGERAEKARPAKPRADYNRDNRKPRLSRKAERDNDDRVNDKVRRLQDKENFRKREAMRKKDDLREREDERKREDRDFKRVEKKRTLAKKPSKAKEARKPVEKLKKIKTRPAKEGGSGQESDDNNEENASYISVNGDK